MEELKAYKHSQTGQQESVCEGEEFEAHAYQCIEMFLSGDIDEFSFKRCELPEGS